MGMVWGGHGVGVHGVDMLWTCGGHAVGMEWAWSGHEVGLVCAWRVDGASWCGHGVGWWTCGDGVCIG